jgi:DNA topoisomerase-1
MSAAVYNQTKVHFQNTNSVWSASGTELTFDGYLEVYGKEATDEVTLPSFKLGESYNAGKIQIVDKETQPKSRYTEASLIKDMEDLGLGRPST